MRDLIRKLFFLFIFASTLLTACAPVVESHADGAKWVTSEQMFEYKRVKTGSRKVGDVSIPTYGNRWRTIDSAQLTGTDREPVAVNKLDCVNVKPENPELGDKYCENLPTKYYLMFAEKYEVEVTEEVWRNHTPNTVYKTQETPFGGFRIIYK